MRYHELTEAPIADFGIVNPEGDKYVNNFDKSDKGILNNDKGVKKIVDAFSKTPFDFNIYVIMKPSLGIWGDENTSFEEAKELIKDYVGVDVVTQNRITCVYLTNTSRFHRMPMNAWTIAHRMIHMLQVYPNKTKSLSFERTCWYEFVKLANESTNIGSKLIGDHINMVSNEYQMLTFVTSMMTMKSARNNTMASSLDIGGELLAQYLLTGRIRLAPWAVARERLANNETIHRNDDVGVLVNRNANDQLLDKMVIEAEAIMNKAAEEQLRNLVGRILWF